MLQSVRYSAYRIALSLVVTAVILLCAAMPVRAADYNCGAYGVGEYNENVCAAATTDDDSLANTGQTLAIAIPAALILAGTLWLYHLRRKAKRSADTS